MIDLKTEFKNMMLGLVFVLILFYTIVYFKLSAWQTIALLVAIQFLVQIYSYWKNKVFNLKDFVLSTVYIIILVHLIRFLHQFGIIGYIFAIILIVGFILGRRWAKFMQTKEHIEAMIWGKPLKEYIAAGKKPPKLKFDI